MATAEEPDQPNVPRDSDSCWICYMSYEEEKENISYIFSNKVWVAPCKCKGTSMWVHQECLQTWIDEKQKGDASHLVRCHQCHTGYRYKFPTLDPIATLIQASENMVDAVSPYVCFCAATATCYLLMTGYGYMTLVQVIGQNETAQLTNDNELIVWISLPLIPICLTLTKYARIEDILFKYLKLFIPPVMNRILGAKWYHAIWPQAPRAPNDVATRRHISLPRAIMTALLLPSIACIIGKLVFFRVENNLKRSLLGGATYLTLRYVTKIYYKYRSYQNMSHRQILNYYE